MRPIIFILSCFAFLFHLGVGCCAHHSHAMEGNSRSRQITTSGVSQGAHRCHHPGAGDSSPCPSAPDESCDHVSCTFIGASTSEMAKTTTDGLTVVPSIELPNFLAKSQNLAGITRKIAFLPVRIHLFNQLFLN